ncbi:MAG: hypothetical protein ACKVZ0_25310 [Gemmatimonadales bacterium]
MIRRIRGGRTARAGMLAVIGILGGAGSLAAQAVCGTPGKDGPGGVLTGVVNTYYPGVTASVSSGATTLTLGTATGASVAITPGDLLLVIQVQAASINSSNTANYGDGTGVGRGWTDPGNSGRFEYVTATNAVGLAGGVLTFRGTGAGNGLLNGYADAGPTASAGQRRYQVVRVPQYSSATLSGGLTASYWNGTTGGILAIDVAGQVTLGGTVSVNGRGFRGGAGLGFNGGAGGSNTDFRNLSSLPFHGMKGEGIAGTPRWVLNPATSTNLDLGVEGYPNGDAAQGAPGNAGGGGTDGNTSNNEQNSGGGGGSNGGAGGQGGFTWNTGLDRGGRGGAGFLLSGVDRVIFGGGGGAGSRNNSAAPQNAGGAGGGIVMIRAGTVAGTGTITANGLDGFSPANDGAGGGGAGGSVVVLVASGGLGGLSVQARGGRGGNAWATQSGASSAHGPGGGGGGGATVLSSAATVDVAGGAHGITTTGNLTYGSTDGAGGRSVAAAIGSSPGTSASPSCVPNLTVTKSTSTPNVNNTPTGTTATYTIVVSNTAGRDTARSVALIDTLATGFTFASASVPVLSGGASRPSTTNPAAGAAIPIFATFSIPGGGQVSQTFVVNVASSVPNGVYNNPASANYLDPARLTPTGTTSSSYNIAGNGENVNVRGPNLVVSKTHVGNFTVGNPGGSYTITVRNTGNRSTSGTVTVRDTLPTGLSFVSGIGTNWTCALNPPASQVVVCTRPNAIAAGGTAPAITLTVNVAAAAVPGVTNVVWVSGGGEPAGNSGNNSASDPTVVNAPSADVVTTKTGPATGSVSTNLTYTITVANAGPNAATGVVATDTLPAGATFVSASGGGTHASGVVTWPAIASLANGANTSFTVTVSYPAAGSYTNIAASTATTSDPTPGNNNGSASGARVTTVITGAADLSVTKSGPATASAGNGVSYTVQVSNAGPGVASNVVVTDTLPGGATFVSATGGGTLSGNVVTWPTIASLANGANSSFTVTLSYAQGGSYTNVAAASSPTPDPTLPNRATAATTVTAVADVQVTKSGAATAAIGSNVTYTITATNSGPSDAAGVVVTDTLAAGVTFVSASPGGTLSGNVVTWPATTIATGANTSYTVTVSFPTAGSFTDIAASTATTSDPTPGNNNGSAASARVTTTVTPAADVVVAKSGPATAAAGTDVTYTITATNNGPSDASTVVVTDTLPAGATFISATGGGTLAGAVVTWPAVATLANGANTSVTVTLRFAAAGSYTNIAAASATTGDPNTANNRAAAPTTVTASADVVTTKSGPASVLAGADAVYTITALNNGPSAATNVVITDTLPTGATFVSATNGGSLAGLVVTWPAIGSLANGGNVSYTVTVRYSATGTYTNIAASTSSTSDPVPGNNDGSAGGARVPTTVQPSADVSVTKTGPASAAAGTDVSYTVLVSNAGPTSAANVSVTDTIPAGATFVSASGGGTLSGSVVTWPTIVALANGGSTSFTVTLSFGATGAFTDVAAASSTTPDPTLANNRATATTVVGPSADVATTKTGPATVDAGVDAVYSIVTINNGPTAATGVTITDTLPAGAAFIGASNSGSLSGNVVTWPSIASLSNGSSVTYTVTVRYAATGTYTNIAASTATSADPVPGNNDGSASGARVTTSVTASDLAVAKTGPATGAAGADLTYTIAVTNNGPSAASTVVITDTLPAGVTFVSASAGGTLTGNVVTWPTIASLANGGTTSVTVTYRAGAAGSFLDVAAVTTTSTDPNLADNRATLTTVIGTSADVVTTKTGPATATAGQNISYAITVGNSGPSDAQSVIVTDTLPSGVTFVSATGGGTLAGNVVTWPAIATLAAGASQSYTLVVSAAAGGSYLNVVASTSTTPDPVPGNNDGSAPGARVTTVVGASADVVTGKTGPATATAGQDINYTITVTNNGPSAATAVVVTDTLPAGLTFVSATGGGTQSGAVVTWPAIASLASGGSQTFTLVARAAAGGSYTNIVASTSATPDPTPGNNDGSSPGARVTTVVGASADVVTTKTGPAAVVAGQDISYTVTVTNAGPSPADNVVVTDTLPSGVTFISATNGGTLGAGVVTWPAIASLAAGGSQSHTVVVRASNAGTYTNIVASTSATSDPTPANNDGSAPASRVATTVSPLADVAVTKTGPATANAGDDVNYTITVTNSGPSAATAVIVTDTIPAGMTFVSATAGGTVAGNVVTWPAIGTLAATASQAFTVVTRATAGGVYTNIAAATSTTADSDPTNNNGSAPAARVTTTIAAVADVVTTKTGPASATAGVDFSYTITVANLGPSAAANVVVTDSVPLGLVFVSASGGGTFSSGVVTFPTIPSLASGGSASFTVTVTPTTTGSFTNIVASTSTTSDPTPANNDGSAAGARVTTAVSVLADVATSKTGPATATAGQDISYTITAQNQGPSTATGVVVTDTLPAGLTFVSASNGGTATGNVVTWPTVASLASGASVSYTLVVRAANGGAYTNIVASTATTPDPTPANNNGSAPAARVTTTVTSSADVVVTKTGPATGSAGQNASYTITVTNNGPSDAASVVVTDTLPAGVTFVTASGGGTATGNVVSWPTIAALANGASQAFTVTIVPLAAGTYTNIAAGGSTTPDPTPGNNNGSLPAARVTTVVAASADVFTTKSGPATGLAGQDLTYAVSVTNAGPSPAADVVVTDTIPAGMTFVSASGGGTASGAVVTWPSIASLANGASTSYTVTLRPTAAGSFLNLVASTATTPDPNAGNNNGSSPTSQVVTVVGASADLVTTKSGPATAVAGQDITYSITTTNNGPSAASDVVVSDTLAAGLTFVSASNGGTLTGSVVTWPAVASVANGGSVTYTVVVRAANAGSYLDIAAAQSSTPDLVSGNNDGSAPAARVTTVVTGSADLVTTKSGPPTATAGQDVTYTVMTLNNGPSSATAVVVSDTLAAGAVFVSASNGGTVSGNTVTWPAVLSLANGGTLSYTVTVRFNNAGGYLDIAASTSSTADPVSANNDGSAPNAQVITVIGASADLATTKTGPAAIAAGLDAVYTVVTENNGPSAATDVVVTDSLPAGATFVSASNGGILSGAVVTWPTVASLGSAGSLSYTVTVRYLPPGTYLNIAASTSTTPDPFPTNNDGSPPDGRISTAVGPNADIVATKTGPATATAGQNIGYAISVANNGPTTALDVVVTDTLPAGVTFVSASGGGTLTGNVITWPTIASMANGGTASFTVVVRALGAGTYLNRVAATSSTPDPDLSNNDGSQPGAQVTTVVGVVADVATTKSGPAQAVVGQNFSYLIATVNNGPSTAQDVVVTDTLPAGITVVSISGGGSVAGTVVTWPTIPSLTTGTPVTFTVTVRASTAGTYVNRVASSSTSPDPNPANNNGSTAGSVVTTVVSTNAALSITKTGPPTANANQDVSYNITVTNAGPAVATNLTVTDTLPAGVTLVFASSGGILTGNVVTWPLVGVLASGSSLSYAVIVRAANPGSYTDVAAATSTSPDPNLADNRATATTVVQAVGTTADVVTTKTGPASIAAGGAIVYTVQTINNGPSAAANVVITDTLPANAAFQSATGGAVRSGNVLTWPTIPTLANGASVTFTVTLTAPASGSVTNIAASSATTPDPLLSNNNGSAVNARIVTSITATADLAVTKTGPANAPAGSEISYLIEVVNNGPAAATNVVITDSIPAGTLFVSASDGAVFANGVVTWPVIGSLASGATATRTVTLRTPDVAGSITNVARANSPVADPNPANNRGTTTTTLSTSADVVTTKTGPAKVDAGAEISYRIVAKNRGPNAAVAVVVTDSLPPGVTFVTATGGGTLVGSTVVWPVVASLAVGDSVVFGLTVTAPTASATLTNIVSSTSPTPDPDQDNNDGSLPDSRVTTEVAPADVAIEKTHLGDLIPGTIASYQLVIRNVGPSPTVGPITVRDTLPSGLTLQSVSGPGWACVNAGPIVTCRYDAVPFAVGASTTITLKALVATNAPATIVNRAHVSTPGDTEPGGNNTGTDQATVSRINPIVVEKVASRSDVEIGDVVDYTVLIRNRSAAEVLDVTVTDVLPKGFTYQRGTARVDLIPIADPAGAPGPTLAFLVGDLEANGVIRLTYRVKVGAGATLGDGINQASARSATGIQSAVALSQVRVRGGVFTDRGIIMGKVYLRCDCDSTDQRARRRALLERDSVGVPGVRVFLEDGASVVTDLEGKFNLVGVVSGLHVLKVDPTSVPRGGRLVALDSRNAGDSSSRFVDLKNGELHKADFAIQFADSVWGTVDRRRERGAIVSVIVDTLAGTDTTSVSSALVPRDAAVAEQDRPVIAVDPSSDTAKANAYRPLAAAASANPIDEANRLPVTRLPGTTVPLTAVPNGSVELTPARRQLPADGNTAIAVRVAIRDQDRQPITSDQPITLEASLGRWLVPDLDPVEPGIQTTVRGGEGDYTLVAATEAGVGEIRVTNGLRIGTAQVVFLPATRPLFVNGLLEARVDLRSLLRDGLLQVTAADRFERELKDLRVSTDDGKLSAAARGALFLQGKVKGSTLLTLAYDSERDPERRMFRDIQPEEFYPVYGDASIKEFGAQSFDRLYVRVDAERSFALYGDYVTPTAGVGPVAARELGAYQRSLTGALGHLENSRGQLNVFASRDRLSQVVDEIPGRGISGPYQLSRADGRLNSEKVELVTRDRNQPSRIINLVPMARFTDYTVEPFTGRLLFFTPVPSVDQDLNPVSIRISYEVERSGDDFWVYGADGQIRLGDRVEFGASAVRDEQPFAKRRLYSANAAIALGEGTVFVSEFARTDGDSAGFRGDAARFELRHSSAKLQGSIFGATSDAGFSNQSSTFSRGRTELGLRGSAVIDQKTRLIGEALRSEDRIGGGRRTGALAAVERQFGRYVRGEFGYRFAEEGRGPASAGTAATPGASPNETNALRARFTVQVPGQPRASVFGEFEQDIADTDQRRGAFGGQYVLFDRLRIYGRHEFLSSFAGPFALNGAQRQATTVIGLDAGYTKDGQFFGEYRAADAFSGRETEAAIGLRNRWTVSKGLVVNTGFERVDVLKGSGQGEATAISLGAEYTTNPDWRGTARFEYRFAAAGDDFLGTLGYVRRLNRDWTVLGRSLYNTFAGDGKRLRHQVGFAWRETDRNRWNGLARWEQRLEQFRADRPDGTRQRSHILSAHLNYQPTARIWLSGRLASKWANDRNGSVETSSGGQLVSIRALYDFLPRWDAGVIGSSLWSGGKQYGAGIEFGRTVVTNFRAAIGYNLFGFRDRTLLSEGSQTDHGLYLHFGFKFSEEAFKRLAGDAKQP